MTFLAPGFLAAALAAAAGVVLLHLFSYRRPRPRPLPTARFLPDRPVRAVTTLQRPTDLLLLALRALALLLVGAAFAGPVRAARRGSVARIFLVDRSAAVASPGAALDSVAARARPGDAVVAYGASVRPAVAVAADSASLAGLVGAPAPDGTAPASLSAALAAAGRAARLVRARADSVELVIVSPLVAEGVDAATLPLRRAWPGRAAVVPVAAAPAPAADSLAAVELRGAGDDDPLTATVALLGGTGAAAARIVRAPAPTAEDRAWLAAGRGRRLVLWPADGRPAGWTARGAPDTVGAVIAGERVLVAPLVRAATAPAAAAGDTLRAGASRVVARWVDGAPAATERALGAGCVRNVAIPVPAAGDLAIAREFVRLAGVLVAGCGERPDRRPLDAATRRALAGSGSLAASASVGGAPGMARSPLAAWLLAAAAALLLAELLVRRGGGAWEEAA